MFGDFAELQDEGAVDFCSPALRRLSIDTEQEGEPLFAPPVSNVRPSYRYMRYLTLVQLRSLGLSLR